MENSTALGYHDERTCIELPPQVNSLGVLRQFLKKDYTWRQFSAPRFQLTISVIFILTQAFHFVLKRFGFLRFTSQVLAGVLLSPMIFKDNWEYWFPSYTVQMIGTVGEFGYAFFLFHCGIKMDLRMVTRVGRKAVYIGISSVLTPVIYALSTVALLGKSHEDKFKSFYMSPIYYTTSFPVVIYVLSELKILNSELGRLTQSSAVIADIIGCFMIVFMTLLKEGIELQYLAAIIPALYIVAYLIIVVFVVRPIMIRMKRSMVAENSINPNYILVIMIMFLTCHFIAKPMNATSFMAIYVLGLVVPTGPPLGSALVEKYDCVVNGILFPLFVSSCAMRLQSLKIDFNETMIREIFSIAIITLLIKFVACFLATLCEKMPRKDIVTLALLMCCKGIVELASYTLAIDCKFITADVFTSMLIIVFFVGSIIPVIVRRLYDPSRKYVGYHKSKLMDLKPDADLQLVACIHVPTNVSSIINLLGMTSPNKESLIIVNVVHLIRLNGQAISTFISHQKNTTNASSFCYSENVILSFKKFEANHWENVVVDCFTSISPPNMMHDDICILALDKLASLIILPFHRTWYIDGSVESEEPTIRSLNCKVLDTSPCSIGILIDHGNVRHYTLKLGSSFLRNVVMLFLGGPDDREALALAKRMTLDTKVSLTVAQFIPNSDFDEVNWEIILDLEVLKDVKNNDHINYIRYHVTDGPNMISIVHSMLHENTFDLAVVGRRYNVDCQQTSGLKEWSEFPELGILGNVLASKDIGGKCSALIVQQQRTVN